jgi:rhodanese-related sulfurtransferase
METLLKNKHGRGLWQAVVIVLAACAAGLLANVVRPNGLTLVGDWSPEARLTTDSGESMVISLEEAEKVFASGTAVFLDARSEGLYREGRIRGARNLPWQSFEAHLDKVMAEIPPDALIVTYCDGEDCALSEDLARELLFMGYEKVRVLVNGWTRWTEAGLPTEKG